MENVKNGVARIVRTSRGLTIEGTRTTLYSILDYIHEDWSPQMIREWLGLTEAQMTGALDYLDAHREEVEEEYKTVVQQAEEIRQYWEEQRREHDKLAPSIEAAPDQAVLNAKLQMWKARIRRE